MTQKKSKPIKIFKMVWVVCGLSLSLWMIYSMQAQGVSKELLQSDDDVIYNSTEDYYSFTPRDTFSNTLVFFPGALVQPKAYIPLCRKLADSNMRLYIIKMPWRQARYGYNKPKELGILNDSTQTYILAGHSQGAKMAAQFVFENPNIFDKLILIGTTHPRDYSLNEHKIPILKIYGSNDGIADTSKIRNNKPLLPSHTLYFEIEGANHAQFGYYGYQLGDNKAGISRKQQHNETSDAIVAFINT